MNDPEALPRLLDDALSVVIGELPTNIPQANISGLVTDLGNKLASADFTDANVTAKLITGFVSGAGAVAATDTILEAVNKIDGNVAAKLDSAKLVKYGSAASAGGGASEALVVTGLAVGDTILSVSQRVAGANNTAITAFNTLIADGLTIEWTADPGAGAEVDVLVLKA